MKPLVIYHGNCADGFTSAWIARKFFGEENVDFYAGVYQKDPPLVDGRDVILVDFSYKLPVLNRMLDGANSLLVLDHHDTAEKDLALWPTVQSWREWRYFVEATPNKFACCFDMKRSGAGIVWDFFFPGQPRPTLVNHVEDRDLWRFALPGTREIQACLFSFPYDFQVWEDQVLRCEGKRGWGDMFVEGVAIERKHHKDIDELLQIVTRPMIFRVPQDEAAYFDLVDPFVTVPVANLPYTLVSDAGNALITRNYHGFPIGDRQKPHLFTGCYYDGPYGRNFSLRSQEGGMHVGKIAAQWGGGGHKRAAGFRVSFDQLEQFEP